MRRAPRRSRSGAIALRATCIPILGLLLLTGCEREGQKPKPESDAPPVIRTKGGSEMVSLPGGWFELGSKEGLSDESPAHKAWIDSFLLDRYEVTQEQYASLVGENPSSFSGTGGPVDSVSWKDAVLFCNLRSRAEGLDPCYNEESGDWECNFEANGYRLPTEGEWEFACRAGSATLYSFGADPGRLSEHGWFKDNSSKRPHPVGQKKPNPWGLYDMHGNVAEWCNDVYSKNYYKRSPSKNPRGPEKGDIKVMRGGGWNYSAKSCRSAWRNGENYQVIDTCITDHIGIRCVRKAGPRPTPETPSNQESD